MKLFGYVLVFGCVVGCGGSTVSKDAGVNAAKDGGADSDMDGALVDPPDVVDAATTYDVNVCDASMLAITKVTPDLSCSKNTPYTITGNGFHPMAKVEFIQSGQPLTLMNVNVVDASTITAVLQSASIGAFDVIVTNPDGCGTYRQAAATIWCPD